MTETEQKRFRDVVQTVTAEQHARYNIGTYKEKELHRILKYYFEPDQAFHEAPLAGYIADIFRDGVITEIETGGFSGLKPKLGAYLPEYPVQLVYPVCARRYISWIDPDTADVSAHRKSPKKGNAYDVLYEMVRILPYVCHRNLTIAAPLLEVEEYRLLNGWSRDRKKGSERYERIPTDLYDILYFSDDADYRRWIPETCPPLFTVKIFAQETKLRENHARAVMKVLETRGVLEKKGKEGRAYQYARTDSPGNKQEF